MKQEVLSAGRTLPRDLRAALKLFFLLTGLCVSTEIICACFFHLRSPYNWPLPPLQDRFSDFTAFEPRFRLIHSSAFVTMGGFPFTYPPASAPVIALFYALPAPLTVYITSILAGFFVAGLFLLRALRRERLSKNAVFFICFAFAISYPLWFELEQGNCEFFVWTFAIAGLTAYLRGNDYVAAACFGICGAMKLYPFFFLALLVPGKKYRQISFGFAIAAIACIASLWLETGDIALSWKGTGRGADYLQDGFLIHPIVFYDHSLFELLKDMAILAQTLVRRGAYKLPLGQALVGERIYLVLFGILACILFFTRIRKLPPVNQIIAITVLCLLLPPISFDYTLLHLYFPCLLVMLVAIRLNRVDGLPVPGLRAALLIFAVLLSPQTELSAGGRTLSSAIKCSALAVLLVVSLRSPFHLIASCDQVEGFDH